MCSFGGQRGHVDSSTRISSNEIHVTEDLLLAMKTTAKIHMKFSKQLSDILWWLMCGYCVFCAFYTQIYEYICINMYQYILILISIY